MAKIPFLLLGDGPHEPTGLGRIARDLAALILGSDLPLDLVQVGGTIPPCWTAWRHIPLERGEDWGAKAVEQIYASIWGRQPGILFAIWDPSRLYPYLQIDLPVQRWAYCAIDSENTLGAVGGPAAEVLHNFDRILAYGRYGAEVIKQTIGRPVSYLPHGIMLETYRQDDDPDWTGEIFGPHALNQKVLGSVMTNQPRKDFGLFFGLLAELRRRQHRVYGWLHTDVLVKDWAVQQLTVDFGLTKKVTVTTNLFSDQELAQLYRACDLTVLPSLGEGFGYPIVESYAAGRMCIHSDWGGGVELVPKTEWRVPVRATRLESVYALKRPVLTVEDWANAVERAWRWRDQVGVELQDAYCRGAVAHLGWDRLKDRWLSWIRKGLQ